MTWRHESMPVRVLSHNSIQIPALVYTPAAGKLCALMFHFERIFLPCAQSRQQTGFRIAE